MQTRSKSLKLTTNEQGDKLREIYGVATNESPFCFDEPKLKAIWNQPGINVYGTPKYIIVGVDPCNGRFKTTTKITSKFAIVSCVKTMDTFCLTGYDNVEATVPEHYVPIMLAHFRDLQRRFPHSMFVVIVDGMTGMDASRIEAELRLGLINNIIMMGTGTEKPGVLIGPEQKRDFMITMSDAINSNRINFHKEITTSSDDPAKLKAEFLDQMCKYSQLKVRPEKAEAYTPVSIHFTGKLTHGMQDDLCVTFQMMLYYWRVFEHSPKYKKFNI